MTDKPTDEGTKNRLRILYWRPLFKMEAERLLDLLGTQELELSRWEAGLEDRLESELPLAQDPDHENLIINYHHEFQAFYPQKARASSFLTLWAWYEHRLHSACGILQRYKGVGVGSHDLKGYGPTPAMEYLKLVGGFDPVASRPVEAERWGRIKRYYTLRNVLVHSAGFADAKKAAQLKSLRGVRSTSSVIAVENELLYVAFDDFCAALDQVADHLVKLLPSKQTT